MYSLHNEYDVIKLHICQHNKKINNMAWGILSNEILKIISK